MKTNLIAFLSVSILLGAHLGAAGQDKPFKKELKAAVLHGSEDDLYVPALQYKLSYEKETEPWTGSWAGYFKADSEGTLATDARANSKNLFAALHGGLNWELTRTATAPPFPAPGASPADAGVDLPLFDEEDEDETETGGKEAVRFGNVMLTASARFETDQPFENYQVAFGPHLGYVHRNADSHPWWSLVPKVQLNYHRVEVLQSRSFVTRGIEEDAFWRFDALADWTFKVGQWIDPKYEHWFGGAGFHGGLKYYRGFDMPAGAEPAGLDQSWYYSGGVNYRLKPDSAVGKWISFVYLTVGNGRIPPQPRRQTQVFLGVAVNFD